MHRLLNRLRTLRTRAARAAVRRLGVPPSWVRYRWLESETVQEYFTRHRGADFRSDALGAPLSYTTVHPPEVFRNPLPRTIGSREQLPDDPGWWGYSFWDVPERTGGETFIARVPDARIVHYRRRTDDQFYPAIINSDDLAFDLREIRYRTPMAPLLQPRWPVRRLERATWILERVFHNHSHWLTAHLPKILLLRERGMLGEVIMPDKMTPVIEGSLRMLGIDPGDFHALDPGWVTLAVDELTIIGSDRFRPELLRSVHQAFARPPSSTAGRRIFISRARATRRRLLNEEEIWQELEPHGFERVLMEDLSFEAQVELMSETAVLFSIHGAGLTNMMFCPAGTHVVEIADLSFPNPNFYAVAAALGHEYWVLKGTPVGDAHPLNRDMYMPMNELRNTLPELLAAAPARTGT